MKLYFAPGACSIGIHYLLERMGSAYDRQKIDIRGGENRQPWFLALNPKAKVPTLQRSDGSVLTEFPVIAQFLASSAPGAGYYPSNPELLLRASELTDYLVATIHMQGFSRIFRPMKFVADPAGHEAVQAQGRDIVRDGLQIVDQQIAPGAPLGAAPTFADAALFYVLFWAIDRLKLDVPAACAARYLAMRSTPAAARVFEVEGISV